MEDAVTGFAGFSISFHGNACPRYSIDRFPVPPSLHGRGRSCNSRRRSVSAGTRSPLPMPGARSRASARTARLSPRHASPAPPPTPAAEIRSNNPGSNCDLQCDVSDSQDLPLGGVSITASAGDNSRAAAGSRGSPAVGRPHSRQYFHPSQFLLTHPCPPQSNLLSGSRTRGHFYRGQKVALWRGLR
jgi:hypothetical protein